MRTRSAASNQVVADRLIASRLPADERAVQDAIAALRDARLSHRPQEEVRDRCLAVIDALDDAICAAEAAYRLATGPLEGLARTAVIAAKYRPAVQEAARKLERLRVQRQRHLLSAGPACGASHFRGTEPAARVMPYWPESDFLPETTIYRRKVLLPPRR